MGVSPKLLGTGEQVVVHTRTHAKALIWPGTMLVVAGALLGAGVALVPTSWGPAGVGAVALLVAAAVGWLVGRPFLRWLTTTYTVTDRRLIARSGIVRRQGTDLQLTRIHDVSSDISLSDRLFGCGTLAVRIGAEGSPLRLVDVPDVAEVCQVLGELLDRAERPWSEVGAERPPSEAGAERPPSEAGAEGPRSVTGTVGRRPSRAPMAYRR